MTGRSLHDALLTVLSDGPLRARLLTGDTSARGMLGREEWVMLRRVSVERLCRMARFLARHYYRERIVRLFRHIRTLAPHTGRDPLAVLDTPAGLASLDQSVLGTHATAERLVSLIEDSLIGNDAVIRLAIPYWRDLVRYHVTMFRVEAGAPLSGGNPGGTPWRDRRPAKGSSTCPDRESGPDLPVGRALPRRAGHRGPLLTRHPGAGRSGRRSANC